MNKLFFYVVSRRCLSCITFTVCKAKEKLDFQTCKLVPQEEFNEKVFSEILSETPQEEVEKSALFFYSFLQDKKTFFMCLEKSSKKFKEHMLLLASCCGDHEVVNYLLRDNEVEVKKLKERLFLNSILREDKKLVKLLLENGIKVPKKLSKYIVKSPKKVKETKHSNRTCVEEILVTQNRRGVKNEKFKRLHSEPRLLLLYCFFCM